MVVEHVDFPIGLDEAEEVRKVLREERGAIFEAAEDIRYAKWSFYEH